jgi:hypothetical protein
MVRRSDVWVFNIRQHHLEYNFVGPEDASVHGKANVGEPWFGKSGDAEPDMQSGDLIIVRRTSRGGDQPAGVVGLWEFSSARSLDSLDEIPWDDKAYRWAIYCRPIQRRIEPAFNENWNDLPFSYRQLQSEVVSLSQSDAQEYLQALFGHDALSENARQAIKERYQLSGDTGSIKSPRGISETVDLEPGETYSAAELRSTFNKSRAGKGIETLYDENDNKYIRLFSSTGNQYGDDLEADPMRYVGDKNYNDPVGDQVPNRGNGDLLESQNTGWPIFLFEKVSENPVRYHYHGRVEVVDYEHNYRPEKDKKEYDFYLKKLDTETSVPSTADDESDDDLAPGPIRDIDPDNRDIPDREERITYESIKKTQAEATNEHENTVYKVKEWLKNDGWSCKETDETDILASTDSKVIVVEVKSIDGANDGTQLRKALGQIFENCYRDVRRRGWGDREINLFICFSQPPSDRYSGYLEFLQEEGIEVLWRKGDEVAGHPDSIKRLRIYEE